MVYLIATVDERRIEWLPQFVQHYQALGVHRCLVSLHVDEDRSLAECRAASQRAEILLRSCDSELVAVLDGLGLVDEGGRHLAPEILRGKEFHSREVVVFVHR